MNKKTISVLICFAMCMGTLQGIHLEKVLAANDITISLEQDVGTSKDKTLNTSVKEDTTGIVAKYNFDNANGSKLLDVSGNGNDATLVGGAKLIPGKNGNSVELNGDDGYVQLPDEICLS